eukprot:COSAG01_NODE_184_length_22692_cov_155.762758_18_plen_111_part_00
MAAHAGRWLWQAPPARAEGRLSRLLGRGEFAAGLALAALCLCGWGCWRCGGEGESFLRVHWVAVPEALRARRVNRRRRRGGGRAGRLARPRPERRLCIRDDVSICSIGRR